MHNIWVMSKQCFTVYSKPLLCLAFVFLLFPMSASAAILPERGGKKFFTLTSVRAGKPGGMKIANAEDKYMSLGGYGGRSVRITKPVSDDATSESANEDTIMPQKKIKAQKPSVLKRETMRPRDVDEVRREKLAHDLVGELGEEVNVNRQALQTLFPEMSDAQANTLIKESAFAWPLEFSPQQRISSHFGTRKDPFTGKSAFHKGIDIAAPIGTSVLACADGTVEEVATHPRLGKYVKIRHEDGNQSVYGHLSAASVHKGDKLNVGDLLGKVGSTGRSTGPHLDFSYRLDGEAINPLPHLNVPTHIKTLELSAARD